MYTPEVLFNFVFFFFIFMSSSHELKMIVPLNFFQKQRASSEFLNAN